MNRLACVTAEGFSYSGTCLYGEAHELLRWRM